MKINYTPTRLAEIDNMCRKLRFTDAFWGDDSREKETKALRLHSKAQGIVSTYIVRMTGRVDRMEDMMLSSYE